MKNIPESVNHLMQWSQWVEWDYNESKQQSILDTYYNARLWLWLYMNKNGITENPTKKITTKNHIGIWFALEETLDRESLAAMTHVNYELKAVRGRYEMVDLTVPIK